MALALSGGLFLDNVPNKTLQSSTRWERNSDTDASTSCKRAAKPRLGRNPIVNVRHRSTAFKSAAAAV
jgi:hypothetical protein